MAKQTTKQSETGGQSRHMVQSTTMSTAAAGLVGAVAGAAVGIALSNKDTRDQIARFINDVRDRSVELKDKLQQEAGTVKEEAAKIVAKQTQDVMEQRDTQNQNEPIKASRNSK